FRQKMQTLVWKMHVLAEVLVPALRSHLGMVLNHLATSEASSSAIDFDLDLLRTLEGYKKLTKDQRPAGFESTSAIDRAIRMVKARAMKRADERMIAGVLAEHFEEAWDKHFPTGYWSDWIRRRAESS